MNASLKDNFIINYVDVQQQYKLTFAWVENKISNLDATSPTSHSLTFGLCSLRSCFQCLESLCRKDPNADTFTLSVMFTLFSCQVVCSARAQASGFCSTVVVKIIC